VLCWHGVAGDGFRWLKVKQQNLNWNVKQQNQSDNNTNIIKIQNIIKLLFNCVVLVQHN